MYVNSYDPLTMDTLETGLTGLNFGPIVKGQHGASPIVIKPMKEVDETFIRLALYLENSNNLDHTQFGLYTNEYPVTGVVAGGPLMKDHFVAVPGVTGLQGIPGITGVNGVTGMYGITGGSSTTTYVELNPSNPEFIWIDAQAGSGESTGNNNVNFRFLYEYN